MTPRIVLASLDVSGLPAAAREAIEGALPAAPAAGPAVEPVIAEREVRIGGQLVRYRVSAGLMPVREDAGKLKAEVFYVAYERLGVDAPAQRPITFAFNGGPGSSSVWLHLGALGPRRVQFGPEGEAPKPPATIIDNDQSWLDATDLVFIDPVSTGFSRPAAGEQSQQFHGVDEDIACIAEFIRLYTTRHERWLSPKVVVGESYGTTRAAGLAAHLHGEHGMYLNGIVLVSPALDFATLEFSEGNDLPFWVALPTYTATAWYHKKLAPDLQADLAKALAESEAFASGEYLTALAKGDRLPAADRDRLAAKLARLTGLSHAVVLRARLRIVDQLLYKELLRDRGLTVGRLDSRYTSQDRDDAGAAPEHDASYAAILGPYTSALNSYMREELRVRSDLKYEILSEKASVQWLFPRNRYASTAESLRSAMTQNPSLKVLVCNGYFDVATPYFASDFTLSHLGLRDGPRANIHVERYMSGHMMYVRESDLAKLRQDAVKFIAGCTAP